MRPGCCFADQLRRRNEAARGPFEVVDKAIGIAITPASPSKRRPYDATKAASRWPTTSTLLVPKAHPRSLRGSHSGTVSGLNSTMHNPKCEVAGAGEPAVEYLACQLAGRFQPQTFEDSRRTSNDIGSGKLESSQRSRQSIVPHKGSQHTYVWKVPR